MFATPWLVQVEYAEKQYVEPDHDRYRFTLCSDAGNVYFQADFLSHRRMPHLCNTVCVGPGYTIHIHKVLGFMMYSYATRKHYRYKIDASRKYDTTWQWETVTNRQLELEFKPAIVGDICWVMGKGYKRDRKRLHRLVTHRTPFPCTLSTMACNYLFPAIE